MRLLATIMLFIALSLGCVSPSAPALPEGSVYPVDVGRGKFMQFESYGGDCWSCITILYTGDDTLLHRRKFYLGDDNGATTANAPDLVRIPQALSAGNFIVITRTGESSYTISKEE